MNEPTQLKDPTESSAILDELSRIVMEACAIESRFHDAVNRLNYDEPQKQVTGDGCDAAKEPSSPPFSEVAHQQLSAMRHTLSRINRHVIRLERFV